MTDQTLIEDILQGEEDGESITSILGRFCITYGTTDNLGWAWSTDEYEKTKWGKA